MKKSILSTFILTASLLFSSCWISPEYKDYEVIDGVYLFRDYDTMKSVTIPMINKSFTTWHWSSETYEEKYEQYHGNISRHIDDEDLMMEKGYAYAVRHGQSNGNIVTREGKTISSEYFWITYKYEDSVIFYQN